MAETADLKSLALRVLQRDTTRDSKRDSLSREYLAVDAAPRQQIRGVSLSRFPRDETPRLPPRSAFAPSFAALERQCPDGIEVVHWRQSVQDARRFLADWGQQAEALGWTSNDLFGLAPVPDELRSSYRRLSRYDMTGLVWLLRGRSAVALTQSAAAIQSSTGAVTIYRRYDKPALGPVGDSLEDYR